MTSCTLATLTTSSACSISCRRITSLSSLESRVRLVARAPHLFEDLRAGARRFELLAVGRVHGLLGDANLLGRLAPRARPVVAATRMSNSSDSAFGGGLFAFAGSSLEASFDLAAGASR